MNFVGVENVNDLLKNAALESIKEKFPENFTTIEDLPYKKRDKYILTLYHTLGMKDKDNSLTSKEKDLYHAIIDYINKYFGSNYIQEIS